MYKIAIALSALTMLCIASVTRVHDTSSLFMIAWLGIGTYTATIILVKPFMPKTDP